MFRSDIWTLPFKTVGASEVCYKKKLSKSLWLSKQTNISTEHHQFNNAINYEYQWTDFVPP